MLSLSKTTGPKLGLCLPKNCTAADYRELLACDGAAVADAAAALHALTNATSALLEGLAGAIGYVSSSETNHCIEPRRDPGEREGAELGWGCVLTLAFIGAMAALVGAATFLEVALRSPRVRWLRELVSSRRRHRDEHATASGAFYDSFGYDVLTDDGPPTSPPPELKRSAAAPRVGPRAVRLSLDGALGAFVTTFSAIHATARLVSPGEPRVTDCINGLRSMSTGYIILGHTVSHGYHGGEG